MKDSDSVIGAHILVGLTYLDQDGNTSERLQLHGHISRLEPGVLYFDRADGGGEFSVPFDGRLELAAPGAIYTLAGTGEKVEDVDFVGSWTIYPPELTDQ